MAKQKDHSAERRDTLRMIGAVGVTCAFPFSADELYGQHAHPNTSAGTAPMTTPYKPGFFTPEEFAVVTRIAGLIIPASDTPGAVEAGAPAYIDQVVQKNSRSQQIYRKGIEWLDKTAQSRHGKKFLALTEAEQTAILEPLSKAADERRIRSAPERFFQEIKNMTADGYYTSRIGLIEELGYKGNTALAHFPEMHIPEQ